jgi:mono/diheme cytochrome c family protein
MKKAFLILFLVPNLFLLAQKPDLGSESQREAGKMLYEKKCSQCHGENGDGQGIAADRFSPLPRNFTRAQFKIRTTANGELPTDSDLKKIIRNGMPYTAMPPWPDLSDEEIENLVYYIKSFSDDFADPDYLPKAMEFPEAPSFSEESARQGRAVFEANECIKCHGNYGRGDGPSATTLMNDAGQHINPADMTKRWTFRGGSSREDIFRTFTTGINGTPMPSYHGVIAPEKQWQLVDYVYSLSKDAADYGILIIAKGLAGEIDITRDSTHFEQAHETLLPVVGQVIEPGREFFPGTNAIKVKAVFNQDDIAVRLQWNNISAEQSGDNSPDMEVSEQEETSDDDFWGGDASEEENYSDAVAVQFPSQIPEGNVKPYFLFGDSRNPVDLWFMDLADSAAQLYQGHGSENITPEENHSLQVVSGYEDGQWTVTFKRKRMIDNKLSFDEGVFIPVALSVWDGFNKERGNKRGITSWYHLYLEPQQKNSVAGPMIKWGLIVALLELGLIFGMRRKYRKK